MHLVRKGLAVIQLALRRVGLSRRANLNSYSQLARWIEGGRFVGLPTPVGGADYTLPSLANAQVESLRCDRPGNWLVHTGRKRRALNIGLEIQPGAKGNIVVIGDGTRVPSRIRIYGNDNIAIFGDNITWPLEIDLRFSSSGSVFFFGREGSSNGSEIILEGDECHAILGDDCMLAADTSIRTSDLHGIGDVGTNRWLNPPAAVLIEPHVWIGHGAMIAKGVTIGHDSVIGARALVTREIPSGSIAAGTPAKVIKSDVNWTRQRFWS